MEVGEEMLTMSGVLFFFLHKMLILAQAAYEKYSRLLA